MGLDRGHKGTVPAQAEQPAVKVEIRPKRVALAPCFDRDEMASLDRIQIGKVSFGHRQDNKRCRMTLKQLADSIDVLDLLSTVQPDDGTSVANPLHKAKSLQIEDGLTHDMALDGKSLGQILLDQPLTRLKSAEDDLLLELISDG